MLIGNRVTEPETGDNADTGAACSKSDARDDHEQSRREDKVTTKTARRRSSPRPGQTTELRQWFGSGGSLQQQGPGIGLFAQSL